MYQFSLSVSEKYVQNYCSCQSFNSYNPTSSFVILNYMKSCNSAINTHFTAKRKLRHTLIPPLIYPASFTLNCFSCLWNGLPVIDENISVSATMSQLKSTFVCSLFLNFNIDNLCIYFVLLLNVYPLALTSYNSWLVIFNQWHGNGNFSTFHLQSLKLNLLSIHLKLQLCFCIVTDRSIPSSYLYTPFSPPLPWECLSTLLWSYKLT